MRHITNVSCISPILIQAIFHLKIDYILKCFPKKQYQYQWWYHIMVTTGPKRLVRSVVTILFYLLIRAVHSKFWMGGG